MTVPPRRPGTTGSWRAGGRSSTSTGPEIDWFRPFVEAGQPALDAACGRGRLLVPYLHAGLDVDGSDISPDMLEHVRERCEREGLHAPNLYAQAMHELDLPRRYRTIFVCGGFGLGGQREHDVEGLRRLYEHLEPGGTLVLDNEVPYSSQMGGWKFWKKDEERAGAATAVARGGRAPGRRLMAQNTSCDPGSSASTHSRSA